MIDINQPSTKHDAMQFCEFDRILVSALEPFQLFNQTLTIYRMSTLSRQTTLRDTPSAKQSARSSTGEPSQPLAWDRPDPLPKVSSLVVDLTIRILTPEEFPLNVIEAFQTYRERSETRWLWSRAVKLRVSGTVARKDHRVIAKALVDILARVSKL
jgi:hypothetical protein